MRNYVLYNPMAGHGDCDEKLGKLKSCLEGEIVEFDLTKLEDADEFFKSLSSDDRIIISGGDGTINKFVNSVDTDSVCCDIYYYGSGSGNDFLHDLGKSIGDEPVKVNEYLKNLPTVEVEGNTYRFVNGVGYGIDGYCCEVGDKIKATSNKPVNYTSIAIKGLLFHFKPRGATVTVDGKKYSYKKVWIAPTMNGRFYGGGMMPAPEQKRNNADGTLSVMLFHRSSKIKTLMIFPSLFKGEHLKNKKYTELLCGKDITVEFDSPAPLQVDGETIVGVMKYRAYTALETKKAEAQEHEFAEQK